MATRMQQRRGTAAQWTAANPILAAGEIGFETDTSRFKMGNGSSTWSALTYFANTAELTSLLDGAPDALNTLNELAAALGDDPAFFTNIMADVETAEDNANTFTTGAVNTHAQITTNIHGIPDTTQLITQSILNDHTSETQGVHGIADTSLLATTAYADAAEADAITAAGLAISNHNNETINVHGILDTADLATMTDVSDAITTAGSSASGYVSTHNSDTTSVHGIADTSVLETVTGSQAKADAAEYDAIVAAGSAADTKVSTHNSDTTSVHGIADTTQLALLSDVAAVTKTTLGLGNVDNTSDADKPVSTATVTAIATAKSEAIAEVTAVIDGAPGALNTLNELAAALGDDANFAGTVATSLAAKVDSYTPITQKTASYTLSTLDHRDDLIEMGSGSALTLTIPLNSSIAYPVGTSVDILQTGTGQVTIAGAAGVTVNATPGLKLRTQWSSATLFKRAENTWVVYGDLTA